MKLSLSLLKHLLFLSFFLSSRAADGASSTSGEDVEMPDDCDCVEEYWEALCLYNDEAEENIRLLKKKFERIVKDVREIKGIAKEEEIAKEGKPCEAFEERVQGFQERVEEYEEACSKGKELRRTFVEFSRKFFNVAENDVIKYKSKKDPEFIEESKTMDLISPNANVAMHLYALKSAEDALGFCRTWILDLVGDYQAGPR